MKTVIDTIWTILVSVGEARHAAWLTRQGRVSEARALYGN